jgi:hypothetical protein
MHLISIRLKKEVASNKSSLLLKIQKENIHTLQLFTCLFKTESIYDNTILIMTLLITTIQSLQIINLQVFLLLLLF